MSRICETYGMLIFAMGISIFLGEDHVHASFTAIMSAYIFLEVRRER